MVRRTVSTVAVLAIAAGLFSATPLAAHAASLSAPTSLAATPTGDLTLTWNRVEGATGYTLEMVADPANAAGTLVHTATTAARTYVVPRTVSVEKARTVHWRVAATYNGSTGTYSDWTPMSRSALAAPVPLAPGSADGATVQFPKAVTFRWTPVPGAVQYRVEYSTDPDFGSDVTPLPATTATSYTPNESLTRMVSGSTVQWYWHVRAEFYTNVGNPVIGPYSETFAFQIVWSQKPVTQTPAAGSIQYSDLRFTWLPVAGAASYKVELAQNPQFTGALPAQTVYGTTWVPTTTLLSTDYYWRVTPIDASNNLGTASTTSMFTKFWGRQSSESAPLTDTEAYPLPGQGSPDVANPPSIPIDKFELSWAPLARASHYDVIVSPVNDNDPSTQEIILTCRTANTSVTPIGTYTAGNGRPDVLKSAAGCLNQAPLLVGRTYSWSVTGIDYAGNSTTDLQSPPATGTVRSAESGPIDAYLPERARYIKVGAASGTSVDAVDLDESAWATATAPALKGQPAPVFDWSRVTGADAYQVELVLNTGVTNQVAILCTTATRLRPNGVLADNTTTQSYIWRVQAITGTCYSPTGFLLPGWSAERFSWQKLTTPTDFVGVEPTERLTDGTVLLRWRPQFASGERDGGSRGYQISIYNGSSLVGAEKVEYPFYAAQNPSTKKPLSKGAYTFTVAPLDANGNPWQESEAQPFTVEAPAPEPAEAITDASSAVLSWSTLALTASYRVDWRPQGGTFTSVPVKQAAYTLGELAPGTYEWKVRSLDSSYPAIESIVSATQQFTIVGRPPVPTTPSGVVLGNETDVLTWSAVTGASRYQVRIAESESGLLSAQPVETVATSFAPTADLHYGTEYWWNVAAVGEKALSPGLGTSTGRSFKVVTAPRSAPYPSSSGSLGTTMRQSWTALTGWYKGSSAEPSYDLRYRVVPADATNTETGWVVVPLAADTLEYSVSGLKVATTYEAMVRAKNAIGAGPWSSASTYRTSSVPGVVQNLVATPLSTAGQLQLTWSPPVSSSDIPAANSYQVSYRKTASGTWTTPVEVYSPSHLLTGLTTGTAYTIEVRAKNSIGLGAIAIAARSTFSAPSAPTGVVVTRGNASAKVAWAAPASNGGTALAGYTVQTRYYTTAWSSWSTRVNPSASTLSTTLTGLVNGRRYEVKVLARNAVATGAASTAVAFVPATKPSTPSVKGLVYTGKIKISWVKPALNGSTLTGYKVYRSYDKKTWTAIKTVSASTLSYTWTGPAKGKRYYFGVLATSTLGDSAKGTTMLLTAR